MDQTEALDIMVAVRNKVPEADRIALDAEYVSRFMGTTSLAGSLALEGAQSETDTTTPETPIISSEGLLATLDTALKTYNTLLDITNGERAKVQGEKKPEQLKAIDRAIIRAEVEALVSDPSIITELQIEADYFTANPETDSPEVGFDIVIIPDGLTTTDEQAIAEDLQAKIIIDYKSPQIRLEAYNDKKSPVITGKGYRIAFAPRHYNVPKGSTSDQTNWMKNKNQDTVATQLQTATNTEALAQINNLQVTGELNNPNTRFHGSYFRRFDQAPINDYVSRVCIVDSGKLLLGILGKSYVHHSYSARALVVPKKLNA